MKTDILFFQISLNSTYNEEYLGEICRDIRNIFCEPLDYGI